MEENNQEARWEWTLEWSKLNKHVRRFLMGFLVILTVLTCVYLIVKCGDVVLFALIISCCVALIYIVGLLIDMMVNDASDFD
ncbi:hypothetical protein RsoM2USA_478 [Ralstonia phage RsoM2USA]|nr:hypothetical protein RsoM2USA_478 [Ralstonia phage RsoM2USA]